eukprot:3392112-Amphidinium_carterae.1
MGKEKGIPCTTFLTSSAKTAASSREKGQAEACWFLSIRGPRMADLLFFSSLPLGPGGTGPLSGSLSHGKRLVGLLFRIYGRCGPEDHPRVLFPAFPAVSSEGTAEDRPH